jgi:Ca2+-binding EF-hand superfamily protein
MQLTSLNPGDIENLFSIIDSDHGGTISYQEFLKVVEDDTNDKQAMEELSEPLKKQLHKLRRQLDLRGVQGVPGLVRRFRLMDKDGSGQLDLHEFKRLLVECDLKLAPAQAKTLFSFMDKDNGGGISVEEFVSVLAEPMSGDCAPTTATQSRGALSSDSPFTSGAAASTATTDDTAASAAVTAPAPTAAAVSASASAASGTPSTTAEGILVLLKAKLEARGACGLAGLVRRFQIVDRDHSGYLDRLEFAQCLASCGLAVTPAEAEALFGAFDADGDGTISRDEFVGALNQPEAFVAKPAAPKKNTQRLGGSSLSLR